MTSFRLGGPAAIDCDDLIIGSGAGGAAVADVLTRAGRDVVMIEEGPYVPAARAPGRASLAMPLMWRGAGITGALGNPPVAYAEGRCVGGSTEINSAIFQRPREGLFAAWAKTYGIADFDDAALAPYFDRAAVAVNASYTPGPPGPPTDILRDGAARLGWSTIDLMRGQRHCVGTNQCSFGCPTGAKQSMTNSLLPAALARGLRLIAECRAERIVVRHRRVEELRAVARDADGMEHALRIRPRRVFLCAGAIHTPTLLRRNRLSRNAGTRLRLHPTLRCLAIFDRPVDAHLARLPLAAVTEFAPDFRLGGSVMTPGLFGVALAEDWPRRRHLADRLHHAATYYAMAGGAGVGAIHPLPGAREPLVTYRLDESDWAHLAAGLSRLAELLFVAGARAVYPAIRGHDGWTTAAAAREFCDAPLPRRLCQLMTIHLFGSVIPGEDAGICATDSFGRVGGVENLIVADASQIPEAPGTNPQATVMALAYRNAEHALTEDSDSRRHAFAEETAR